MITPAEMFGAFNRLAAATVIQEFQAAFSGGDQPPVANQASPQASAPPEIELPPPVASSSEPALAAFLPAPSQQAGQTLLGLRAPQTTSAPASSPAAYLGEAGAPTLTLTSVESNAGGTNASPAPAGNAASVVQNSDATLSNASDAGRNAAPTLVASLASDVLAPIGAPLVPPTSGVEIPSGSNDVEGDASASASKPPSAAVPPSGDATTTSANSNDVVEDPMPQSLSPVGRPNSLSAIATAPTDEGAGEKLDSSPVALTDVAQPGEGTPASGLAGEAVSSLATKVQASGLGSTLVARVQTPPRTAASPASAVARANASAAIADAGSDKGRTALEGAPTNGATDEPRMTLLSPLMQRQGVGSVDERPVVTLVARLEAPSEGSAPRQMQNAGVVDAFILNAAMIPGWPLQRPFEPLGPEALGADQPVLQQMDDEELVEYLAAMGANELLSERVRKASDDPVRRRKLLRSLVILISIVTTIIDSMRAEVEALVADLRAGQAPGVALAPHSRRRLLLE